MSQLQLELVRLAQELPPEIRDRILAFRDISEEVWKANIPDVFEDRSTPGSINREPDFGNPYEQTLDVILALRNQTVNKLLEIDNILGDNEPAKILNVVASVRLAETMDLNKIAENAWNSEYNKKQFAGLVIQVNNPKATGVVYSTGRMIITGARSEKDCEIAAKNCMDVIRDAGCEVNSQGSYRIQNICGTASLGYKVRIYDMANGKDLKDSWKLFSLNQDMFSGLVCNFEDPKLTVVCFATGTLMFSGAHREDDIQIALFRFRALAFRYRH